MKFSASGIARPSTFSACSLKGWCPGMSLALEGVPENAEAKGLSATRGWLGEEPKARLLGVTYHRQARDQGIVLNFCPWCRADLRFDVAGGAS